MVLDVKALTWAAQHNIDTAKLKAAKVPIYGKWYFPEIPPGSLPLPGRARSPLPPLRPLPGFAHRAGVAIADGGQGLFPETQQGFF